MLLLAWTGCEPATCTSSAECSAGEICAGRGFGPYHCLLDCTHEDVCPLGDRCVSVAEVDCPTCHVEINACVGPRPPWL